MRALAISVLAGAVALTGCVTDPATGQSSVNKTAVGAAAGAAAGFLLSKSNANKESQNYRAAAIGAALGGGAGYVLDQKEKKLKEQLAGSGVAVDRNEDGSIGLIMPGNITFPTNSYSISPSFYSTLDKVAQTLGDGSVAVVVSGYTDSTGNDGINIPLSKNRAASVKQYLINKGVSSNRINSDGYGSQSPIADNSTPAGREKNRRVEINVYAVS